MYRRPLILGWCLFALWARLLTLLDSNSSPAPWIMFQIIEDHKARAGAPPPSGEEYQHATANFVRTFNDHPPLKAPIIGVYTEAPKWVWRISIVFTIFVVPPAPAVEELEFQKTLETDFGLKQESRKSGLEVQTPGLQLRRRRKWPCCCG
ncbi:hypothetical protein BGZ57DRAFT_972182 [Hyaloscypha finlandica]|nr:hypothetical protein BGZ57DRAFT_972182 [Hyaloscypha finlandica]